MVRCFDITNGVTPDVNCLRERDLIFGRGSDALEVLRVGHPDVVRSFLPSVIVIANDVAFHQVAKCSLEAQEGLVISIQTKKSADPFSTVGIHPVTCGSVRPVIAGRENLVLIFCDFAVFKPLENSVRYSSVRIHDRAPPSLTCQAMVTGTTRTLCA